MERAPLHFAPGYVPVVQSDDSIALGTEEGEVLTGKGDFESDELKAKIAASKFSQWPTYGKSRRGHIGLQGDHGKVWFRKLVITPIVKASTE